MNSFTLKYNEFIDSEKRKAYIIKVVMSILIIVALWLGQDTSGIHIIIIAACYLGLTYLDVEIVPHIIITVLICMPFIWMRIQNIWKNFKIKITSSGQTQLYYQYNPYPASAFPSKIYNINVF